jgi:hypothetical protein
MAKQWVDRPDEIVVDTDLKTLPDQVPVDLAELSRELLGNRVGPSEVEAIAPRPYDESTGRPGSMAYPGRWLPQHRGWDLAKTTLGNLIYV